MKLKMGEEQVIVRGMTYEENPWGQYQFPRPYNLGDRLVVGVHVADDDFKTFGQYRWFESLDQGMTWNDADPSVSAECGLMLPNGDKIYFPMEPAMPLDGYKFTPQNQLNPGYDFIKKAEEGTLPIPDGITSWIDGTVIRAYNADRLPASLSKKEWLSKRIPAGQTEPVDEMVPIEWPYLTRVVLSGAYYSNILKPIFPRGNPKLGPDGAIWITVHSGEGHINPSNGQYSPYYSAELFRSDDNGHSFKLRGHMEYEANGHEFPYQNGGFSDSDIEFMPDGSIVWFLRSTWYMSTGWEWQPMYMSRSTDDGYNWSKPEKFAKGGILPRLCQLECGARLLCYARPGIFVCANKNESGTKWSEPLVVMTDEDRSHLANVVKNEGKTFHDWDGSCNNPEIVPLDQNSAMLFYTDFYYPDENNVKRKTVLCRKIIVE